MLATSELCRLTLATCASFLPVCTDIRGAVPTSVTTQMDLSSFSGIMHRQKGGCNIEKTSEC